MEQITDNFRNEDAMNEKSASLETESPEIAAPKNEPPETESPEIAAPGNEPPETESRTTDSDDDLILVDLNDNEVGSGEKLDVHQKGQLHRAFSIVLFRGKDILIQRRALSKYHSGGLWANTCCSHPRKGESLNEATERRLLEECGIKAICIAGAPVNEEPVSGDSMRCKCSDAERNSRDDDRSTAHNNLQGSEQNNERSTLATETVNSVIKISEKGDFVYRAVFDNGLTEYELDHVFAGECDLEPEELHPDPGEMSELKYVPIDWLQKDMTEHPEKYSAWFPQVFRIACASR